MNWEVQVMKRLIFATWSVLVLGMSLMVQTANASPILTGDVFWASSSGFQTNSDQSPERADIANAYGPPNNEFYSLGLGGAAMLGFGGMVFENGGIATIYETTFGNARNYPEFADVSIGLVASNPLESVVFNGVTGFAGVDNSDAQNGFSFEVPAQAFDNFLVIDRTLLFCNQGTIAGSTCGGDGFDVNALSFEPFAPPETPKPVPVPATSALMALGLMGFSLARRRKNVQ